jgi:hypothetical protein
MSDRARYWQQLVRVWEKSGLSQAELALILEGIDLSHAKRRARFVPRRAMWFSFVFLVFSLA